jgi:hypothetical protein
MKMELNTIEIKTSQTEKMPWASWDIPAWLCKTGSKLAKVKGSICNGCYALKGRYIFGSVKNANIGRFKQIENFEDLKVWQESFIGWFKSKLKRLKQEKRYFRWFTSGDLQSLEMLVAIVEIAKAVPEISFWLPTKEHGMVREYQAIYGEFPENLNVRVSMFMVDQKPSKGLGLPTSTVITNPSVMDENHENLCQASLDAFNGISQVNCNDCRKCWDKNVQNVAYIYH